MEKFVVLITITKQIEQGSGVTGSQLNRGIVGPFQSDEEYCNWCDRFTEIENSSPLQIKRQLIKLIDPSQNIAGIIVGLQ